MNLQVGQVAADSSPQSASRSSELGRKLGRVNSSAVETVNKYHEQMKQDFGITLNWQRIDLLTLVESAARGYDIWALEQVLRQA